MNQGEMKFFQLISALGTDGRRRVEEHFNKGLFVKSPETKRLWDFFTQFNPEEESTFKTGETKEKASSVEFLHRLGVAVYPPNGCDPNRLRVLITRFSAKIETYLAIASFKKSPDFELQKLKVLGELNLEKHFYHTHRSLLKVLDTKPIESETALIRYFANRELNQFEIRNSRAPHLDLGATQKSLDTWFIVTKLKEACALLNNAEIFDSVPGLSFLPEIFQILEKGEYQQEPLISSYFALHKVLMEPENDLFYKDWVRILDENASKIEISELQDIHTFALNYCIRQANSGKSNYLMELFEVYKKTLATGTLLESEGFNPWHFKNIVSVGLRLGETKWVQAFFEEHIRSLPPRFYQNAYTYNLARIHFYQKDYPAVLKLLQKVEYEDVFYNLDSKVMLLKTYYELNEDISLDYLLATFRKFLKRNKQLSQQHKTNYLNLIKYLKKLLNIAEGNTKGLQELKSAVLAQPEVADVDWLLAKIENRL